MKAAIFSLNAGTDLSLLNSVVGANCSTASTADASIRVNYIDFSLGDCLYGAYGQTSSTGDTSVSDYVSHNFVDLVILVVIHRKFNPLY